MNVSGILIVVRPDALDECENALRALPGIDVHYRDADTGRLVVTQEAESVGAEVDGLRRIQGLPKVIFAEMVYHYFAEDSEIAGVQAAGMHREGGLVI
jgi:periplasmic nitrate reductase NapD